MTKLKNGVFENTQIKESNKTYIEILQGSFKFHISTYDILHVIIFHRIILWTSFVHVEEQKT